MKEVEVKILEVNRKEVEENLLELGAKKVFDDVMEAYYFDDEENSLKKKGVILRVRKEGDQIFLFVKKNISKERVKSADEEVVKIESFDALKEILGALGLFVKGVVKKKRVIYKFDSVSFCFDKYVNENSFIPEFLEIEAESEETVFKYAELFGFSRGDCKPWSFKELKKHYEKQV